MVIDSKLAAPAITVVKVSSRPMIAIVSPKVVRLK